MRRTTVSCPSRWVPALARATSAAVCLAPGSRGDLGPQEMVSRFIYTEKNIKKSEKRPRPNAFEPPPEDRKENERQHQHGIE